MHIGFTEILMVLVVALIVLGPDKLPVYARKMGAALSEFRKASDEAARELRENVAQPLADAQKPLQDAVEPVEEINRTVRENWKDVKESLEHPVRAARSAPSSGTASAPSDAPSETTSATPETPSETVSATPDVHSTLSEPPLEEG